MTAAVVVGVDLAGPARICLGIAVARAERDAVVCASIGVHALHWGLRGCRVYGKVDEGAILVPVRPPER